MAKRKKSRVSEDLEEDEAEKQQQSADVKENDDFSNEQSLYEVLGVERTASQQEIKKAYHKLVLQLHPDKSPGDEQAKEKFQQLQKVISVLGDEEKRALYDHTGFTDYAMINRDKQPAESSGPLGFCIVIGSATSQCEMEHNLKKVRTSEHDYDDESVGVEGVVAKSLGVEFVGPSSPHEVVGPSNPSGYVEHDATSNEGVQTHMLVSSTFTQSSKQRMNVYPILSGSAPGGPFIPELLISFEGHIAHAVWQGLERPVLTCHTRVGRLDTWLLPGGSQPRDSYVHYVHRSGLHHLGAIMFKHVNMPLLSAFVERWHPETNSFHMPWGEMTITLQDVSLILGISIDGHAVMSSTMLDRDDCAQLVGQCLNLSYEEVREEVKSGGLRFATISRQCQPEGVPACRGAIGYLLYLLGSTLFVDKSKDRVSPVYVEILSDLEAVQHYAWGAATLACLYRQLGIASRAGCRQLSGCLTLLEAWIYEYFPRFRTRESPQWTPGQARTLRWMTDTTTAKTALIMQQYRTSLDCMRETDVIWQPYGEIDYTGPMRMTMFHGCLHCMEIVEPYMPDRVVRQFGRIQFIPRDPILPTVAVRVPKPKKYKVIYYPMTSNWDARRSHCLTDQDMGSHVLTAWDTLPEYMEWYVPRTHPYIQPGAQLPRHVAHASDEVQRIQEAIGILRRTDALSSPPYHILMHAILDVYKCLTQSDYPGSATGS